MTFREIIDQIGVPVLAQALSLDESHLRTMKARDSIPPEYWGVVVDEAGRREIHGVNFESLRQLRHDRFRGSPSEQTSEATA